MAPGKASDTVVASTFHDQSREASNMSKKRPREPKAVDTELVEIYDDLAHQDEQIRLKAAHRLLTNFSDSSIVSLHQHWTILKRLFRGLCSSRKAARLGFSVAATELLSSVFSSYVRERTIETSEIVDLLDKETRVEGNVSGQEERDHHFGRVFGAESIVKSSILWSPYQVLDQWRRLLNIICGIASKKPWLRQECGWLLYKTIGVLPSDFRNLVEPALRAHDMIRTPEGVAIAVASLSTAGATDDSVWQDGHPLAKKNVGKLAGIMKDARSKQEPDQERELQGSAVWMPQLHFAWEVVLREIYDLNPGKKLLDFETFWLQVVDQSLFASSSSSERKHWGLLLFAEVMTSGPVPMISHVFTNNAMSCLRNQLANNDRYLQRSAQNAIQAMLRRAEKEPAVTLNCLRQFLENPVLRNFYKMTNTKTLEKLVVVESLTENKQTVDLLDELFRKPATGDAQQASLVRRTIADLLAVVYTSSAQLGQRGDKPDVKLSSEKRPLGATKRVLEVCVDLAYFTQEANPPITETSQKYIQGKVMSCIERGFSDKAFGRLLLASTLGHLGAKQRQFPDASTIGPDKKVRKLIQDAFQLLEDSSQNTSDRHGFLLILQLTVLQVFNGEAEAVGILDDLLTFEHSGRDDLETTLDSDLMIEVLLSFASKHSKLLRKIMIMAFEAFTPEISEDGLKALIRVLDTRESSQGQAEMFEVEEDVPSDEEEGDENEDSNVLDGMTSSNDDVDVDMVGSDVEQVSADAVNGVNGHQSAVEEDEDEDSGEGESDSDDDAELAAFDAKLASALGTRQGLEDINASDSSGSSDEDMSDSEMEALDSKLVEVFRARKDLARPKKQDHRDAKENMANFKNRVLDLVDVYFKQQPTSPLSLVFIIPLLRLSRSTNVKQLADRAISILREYCARCKGPKTPKVLESAETANLLKAVHLEAGREGSNAHASACSSASILLVRTLMNLDHSSEMINRIIDIYAETMKARMRSKACHVQPGFFTDFNNWCVNARKLTAR